MMRQTGTNPLAKDFGSRVEEHNRHSQLAAANVRNDELSDKVKALEEKNATLEESLKEMQTTTSGSSVKALGEASQKAEAVMQDVNSYQNLVVQLDHQNSEPTKRLEEYHTDALLDRVARLQGQVEIYKMILTSDRFGPGEILPSLDGTQMKQLVKSGLHRHNPARHYVSETYYRHSENVQERIKMKARKAAMKPIGIFAFNIANEGYLPVQSESNEIIWNNDSE